MKCRNVNQGRNTFHALAQNIIGRLEGVQQGDFFLADELQALVRDNDQRIHPVKQAFNTYLGNVQFALALKGKGLCDDAYGKDAKLFCHLCHYRRGTRAGAAAHARRNERHLCAFQRGGYLITAFFRAALANFEG